MAENEELFRTTLMGGFDKDDVLTKFQDLKNKSYAAEKKLEAQLEEKNQEIQELYQKLKDAQAANASLQKNIKEKYQSYIDNYDSISQMIFEAQVKAKKLVKDAEDESEKMRASAASDCEKQRNETAAACQKQQKDTKEQCEKMMEDARQRGEKLVARYEQQLQAEAEQIQGHMVKELTAANEKYRRLSEEIMRLSGAMEESRKIFGKAFEASEAIRTEMTDSRKRVEKFMADPVKNGTPVQNPRNPREEAGLVAAGATKSAGGTKQEHVEILEENEAEYLDEADDFDDEIHRLLSDDEEEEL
ncbi:MAG: hypothetical protein ACI4EG_11455 [Fusicatenibacter sp.]|nr:hypothetical protein [Fusicatenibacter sp.]